MNRTAAEPLPGRPTTPMEFLAALRQLRIRSGLTFRQLATRSGNVLPPSTTASVLSRATLPKRQFVAAFTQACGLDQTEVAAWLTLRDALDEGLSPAMNGLCPSSAEPVDGGVAPDCPAPDQVTGPAVPEMLPADLADFTGREAEVGWLCDRLDAGAGRSAAPAVAVVSGMGGVGKTSLAVHVAHRLADAFPDGRLYADLRGEDAAPLDPIEVLAGLLRALGVPDRAIPADRDECAGLYRTRLAGRRVLVLLDNAVNEAQVRHLLPGTAGCAVLVTSRSWLSGLSGVQRLELGVFGPAESIELFGRVVDRPGVRSQAVPVEDIVRLCAGLPLAVRIAAARLAVRPTWPLGVLADLLRDERRRLDQLVTGDLAVRASVMISYQALDDRTRRLVRLLGLFDVPDFPAWFGAAVLDCPVDEATERLEHLVDAHLLMTSGLDGIGQPRYRFHDLVRLFARERAAAEDDPKAVSAALERGFGAWLAIAERIAERVPGPCYAPISGPAPRYTVDGVEFGTTVANSVRWFDTEQATLRAVAAQACAFGLDDLAFDLAGCMEKYFDMRGRYRDWAQLNTEVLALCRRAGNRLGEAVMLRGLIDVSTWAAEGRGGDVMTRLLEDSCQLLELFRTLDHGPGSSDAAVMCSWAFTATGQHDRAVETGVRALRLAQSSDHPGGEVRAHVALAVAHYERGDYRQAADQLPPALVRARTLANPRIEATVLQFAGIGSHALGDLESSERMLNASLSISRRYDDTYTEVLTLLALTRLGLTRGDPSARTTAEESLRLSREYGMGHHHAESLTLLGEIALADDDPGRAVGYLAEAVKMWRLRGWQSLQAAALTTLSRAYRSIDPAAAELAESEARAILVYLDNG